MTSTSAGRGSELAPCEICGAVMAPHFQASDREGRTWSYVACSACRLVRLERRGVEELWASAAYPPAYYGEGYSKFAGAVQLLREWSARRRAREISRLAKTPGRMLEIGCGEGLFLEAMSRLGWRTMGCELGEDAARRAEARLGHSIHRGAFETMEAAPGVFDLVMVWHVLEHVPDPAELFRRLLESLSPGGVIVVGVPNGDSWQARLFGPSWFHLDPPRHLFEFTPAHLVALAKRGGATVEEWHHFSLEYNPYGWAQSVLNAAGFRRDAMYETLKRSREKSRGATLLRVLAWFLLAPSVLPAIAEAIVGRGGTVSAYFRKSLEESR